MDSKQSMVVQVAQGLARFFARHPKAFLIAVIAYVVSPIDLIPEGFLGPVGFLDDIVVLILPLVLREYARKLTGKDKPSSKNPEDYYDTTAR
jgi:uncharacterized membrane protein YkvA (DUF1232 family)